MTISGTGGNVLVDQRETMGAALDAALQGKGKIFLRVVSELPDQVSGTTLFYDKKSVAVRSGAANGTRVPGAPHPYGEPGDYGQITVPWKFWGEIIVLDRKAPGLTAQSDTDFEAKGTMIAAARTAEIMESALGGLLNSSTNPWTVSVTAMGTALSDTTNADFRYEYETALNAWQASTSGHGFSEPNVLVMSKKARRYWGRSLKAIAQAGGRTQLHLGDDELLAMMGEYGIEEIVVGDTTTYGNRINAFYRPPSRNAETGAAGIVWGHPGPAVGLGSETVPADRMAQIGDVTVKQDHSIWEFLCEVGGGLAPVPDHGFQMSGAY